MRNAPDRQADRVTQRFNINQKPPGSGRAIKKRGKMKPVSSEIFTPKPFFKIKFECGNTAFYRVRDALSQIADKINIEIMDGYIDEKCESSGDLERIIIYRDERSEKLVSSVLDFYEIKESVPDDLDIVLSIF